MLVQHRLGPGETKREPPKLLEPGGRQAPIVREAEAVSFTVGCTLSRGRVGHRREPLLSSDAGQETGSPCRGRGGHGWPGCGARSLKTWAWGRGKPLGRERSFLEHLEEVWGCGWRGSLGSHKERGSQGLWTTLLGICCFSRSSDDVTHRRLPPRWGSGLCVTWGTSLIFSDSW